MTHDRSVENDEPVALTSGDLADQARDEAAFQRGEDVHTIDAVLRRDTQGSPAEQDARSLTGASYRTGYGDAVRDIFLVLAHRFQSMPITEITGEAHVKAAWEDFEKELKEKEEATTDAF